MKSVHCMPCLLDGYNQEVHYINHPDAVEGISVFAIEKQAGLIITIYEKKEAFTDGFIKVFPKN